MKVKQLFNFDTVNVQPVNGQGIVRITEFQYNQPLILYLIIEMDHHQQEYYIWINVQFNNYSFRLHVLTNPQGYIVHQY